MTTPATRTRKPAGRKGSRSGSGASSFPPTGTAAPERARIPPVTTAEGATPATPTSLPRWRPITARALVVLGVVLVVVSLFANFVRNEALDGDTFRDTSQELIANPAIRNQIADERYAKDLQAFLDKSWNEATIWVNPKYAARLDKRNGTSPPA